MSLQGTTIKIEKPCRATRIPSGEPVQLNPGEEYLVSQALGGSITLRDSGGLYRIGLEEADALGEEVAAIVKELAAVPMEDAPFSEDLVWDALRQCFDPEIPVNIVDLGLIYDLHIQPLESGRHHVAVKMTLTATGCGMGPTIASDARSKIEALPAVESAEVDIVWDPQWTPHMISDEGRKILGLD
ncbi:MAG: iron-sulfur cluster assembly protein [Oceanipulchritudo sp.]|jgi:probable FeS assembly SUF system protein SufT